MVAGIITWDNKYLVNMNLFMNPTFCDWHFILIFILLISFNYFFSTMVLQSTYALASDSPRLKPQFLYALFHFKQTV